MRKRDTNMQTVMLRRGNEAEVSIKGGRERTLVPSLTHDTHLWHQED